MRDEDAERKQQQINLKQALFECDAAVNIRDNPGVTEVIEHVTAGSRGHDKDDATFSAVVK